MVQPKNGTPLLAPEDDPYVALAKHALASVAPLPSGEMPPLSEKLPSPVTEPAAELATSPAKQDRPLFTRGEFENEFKKSRRGRRMVYHIGFLMHDRVFARHAWHIDDVGNAAAELAYAGLADLTQERIGPDLFRYFITKRATQ